MWLAISVELCGVMKALMCIQARIGRYIRLFAVYLFLLLINFEACVLLLSEFGFGSEFYVGHVKEVWL